MGWQWHQLGHMQIICTSLQTDNHANISLLTQSDTTLILSPLDCMPTSLLKEAADVMAPLLAQLANLSFTTGEFPARYKLGHIIPLLKKSGLPKDDPANYRPINNLPTFSKLLERLALNRLQPHVL